MEDVNEWIRAENEKRMAEAEALRARYKQMIFNLPSFYFENRFVFQVRKGEKRTSRIFGT